MLTLSGLSFAETGRFAIMENVCHLTSATRLRSARSLWSLSNLSANAAVSFQRFKNNNIHFGRRAFVVLVRSLSGCLGRPQFAKPNHSKPSLARSTSVIRDAGRKSRQYFFWFRIMLNWRGVGFLSVMCLFLVCISACVRVYLVYSRLQRPLCIPQLSVIDAREPIQLLVVWFCTASLLHPRQLPVNFS